MRQIYFYVLNFIVHNDGLNNYIKTHNMDNDSTGCLLKSKWNSIGGLLYNRGLSRAVQ